MTHLILGGARSGKSAYAEQLAKAWQAEHVAGSVVYCATAPRGFRNAQGQWQEDSEMAQRIDHHHQRRPSTWHTVEEPLALAACLQNLEQQHRATPCLVLVDCLTLWMMNLLEADCRVLQTERLLDFLQQTRLPLILVSNEIGLGVVPLGQMSRSFVDELGRLHQAIAQLAEQVTFVTAGLPMRLKGA
ncbi:MAG: bifunctional adenosylcobinamide kinase/adenosylcobinamide-phosphate guanylyltransferase [Thiotrichales bacterium]|nr:bifunctional adenosylcobinamide kinase/adenosylcobinamide-phosphate guanylyltransferase [Thiotrichales bacterium]